MLVDPKSINLTFDYDIVSLITGAVLTAEAAAYHTGNFYLLSFELKDDQPNYKIQSKTPEFFWKLPFNCPQDADLTYLAQEGQPRPMPSALIVPPTKTNIRAQKIVAKPGLCDNCVHRLSRAIGGSCPGKHYEPLT